jgi:hypothetical protein
MNTFFEVICEANYDAWQGKAKQRKNIDLYLTQIRYELFIQQWTWI